jgi:aspartyl protease family protein
MQSGANGCLMLWVGAALFGAVVGGMSGGGMSPAAGELPEAAVGTSAGSDRDSGEDDNEDVANSGSLVLERSYDGHFYADAQINGQSIRMLVDTGASAIALARDDARRAGVGISIGMPQVVGQGASGDVHGEVVMLDRVSLGGREAQDVSAVVLDDGEMSLLGQSFLSKFDSVEIRGDKMVLR